jgi:hypothetical protein
VKEREAKSIDESAETTSVKTMNESKGFVGVGIRVAYEPGRRQNVDRRLSFSLHPYVVLQLGVSTTREG